MAAANFKSSGKLADPAEHASKIGTNRPVWRRRIIRSMWLAGLFVSPAWVLWIVFGWPAAIEISYETTRIIDPLTKDGRYVDYVEAFRREFEAPGSVAFEDDPWCQLVEPGNPGLRNRIGPVLEYVDPQKAIPMIVAPHAAYKAQQERFYGLPFSAESDPELAAIVEKNMPWYDAIMAIEPGNRRVEFGLTSRNSSRPILANNFNRFGGSYREVALRLRYLAKLRFGSSDCESGVMIVEKMRAVADRETDIPFLFEQIDAVGITAMAHGVLWDGILSAQHVDESLLQRICSWPIDNSGHLRIARLYDRSERFETLDQIQEFHETADESSDLLRWLDTFENLKARVIRNRIDWNALMRSCNETIDQIVDAMQSGSYPVRQRRLQGLASSIDARFDVDELDEVDLNSPVILLSANLKDLIEFRCLETISPPLAFSFTTANQINHCRIANLAARIVAWRQRHGGYPAQLEQLLELEGFPDPPPNLLIDAFSDKPFLFVRFEDGFIVSIVGKNMIDDSHADQYGRSTERKSDDRIWRWPPLDPTGK